MTITDNGRPRAVGSAGKAQGRPITGGILRRELSMQDGGHAAYVVPMGRPLRLESTIVIHPRGSVVR